MAQRRIELEIRVPNQTRYLSLVGRIGEDIAREIEKYSGDRELLAYQLNLALTEAVANAIKYGCSENLDETVHISINLEGNSLYIRIYDFGKGFDINGVAPPDFDALSECGRGLYLIRKVMDSVRYERQQSRNMLEMIKLLW